MTGARTLIVGTFGVVLIGASADPVQPSLVWNLSASVPVGLYVIDAGVPKLDDYVLIRLLCLLHGPRRAPHASGPSRLVWRRWPPSSRST